MRRFRVGAFSLVFLSLGMPGAADMQWNVGGLWHDDGPGMSNAQVTYVQTGPRISVKGSFIANGFTCEWNGSGTISGNRVEHTVNYTKRPPGAAWSKADGRLVLTVASDGKSMTGAWYNNNGDSGPKHLVLQASPQTPPSANGAHYRVENLIYNAPDRYTNPRNWHDFMVDFANCSVRELNRESAEGRERTEVQVCRNKRRLTFTTTLDGGTPVEYDWAFREDGRIVGGAYKQGGSFGPCVGAVYGADGTDTGWQTR